MQLLLSLIVATGALAQTVPGDFKEVAFERLSDRSLGALGTRALAIRGNEWKHAETPHFVYHFFQSFVAAPVSVEAEFFYSIVAKELGRDLILLTLTFDPTHDTPEVMAAYAAQWSPNADTWRFLTGAPADVDRACRLFGVRAFATEGLMDHSLHTVVIGRDGKLISNIEGNQFTATQLGDVVEAALRAR